MEFTRTGCDQDGQMTGTVRSDAGLPRSLCERYARIAGRLLDQGQEVFVPVVIANPWPYADASAPRRRLYEPDDAPHVAAAVFDEMARDVEDEDVIVLLPHDLAVAHVNDADLAMVVIVDAATWAADNGNPAADLGWAADEITRVAIAARILRAAEAAGVIGTREAADGYRSICSIAVGGLAASRHPDNGETLLTVESPGLITLIDRVVQDARRGAPPPLPLNLGRQADAARKTVARALADDGTGTAGWAAWTPSSISRDGGSGERLDQ